MKRPILSTIFWLEAMRFFAVVSGFQPAGVQRLSWPGLASQISVTTKPAVFSTKLSVSTSPDDVPWTSRQPAAPLQATAIMTETVPDLNEVVAMDQETADRGLAPYTAETQTSDLKLLATTALLITANTVGAGALVLPENTAPAGLVVSTGLFASE